MADYLTTDTELTSVANAIRTKGGTSASLVYPTGFVTAIQNIPSGGGTDVSDTTATAADVRTGKYFYTSAGVKTQGTIQNQAAQTITPGTTDQTIASGKYLSGTQTIKGDANLIAGNIKKNVSIFGVTGSYEGGGGGITLKRIAGTGTETVQVSGWKKDDLNEESSIDPQNPEVLLCHIKNNTENTVYELCLTKVSYSSSYNAALTFSGTTNRSSNNPYSIGCQFNISAQYGMIESITLVNVTERTYSVLQNISGWEILSSKPIHEPPQIFYIEIYGDTVPIAFDAGMTWDDFINSEYNLEIGLEEMDGTVFIPSEELYLYDQNGQPVAINDTIEAEATYYLQ